MGQKPENCDPKDPADAPTGDGWDSLASDPEPRRGVAVVPGTRNRVKAAAGVAAFRRRTGGRPMDLITGAEPRPSKAALLPASGGEATVTPSGLPVRAPHRVASPSLGDATVPKVRPLGRVAAVVLRLVLGTAALVAATLAASRVSRAVNGSFREWQHRTDRHRHARTRRKTDCFGKDGETHEAAPSFSLDRSNFGWPVRTLRTGSPDQPWEERTPARAAGLSNHVGSLAEWLMFPAIKLE